MPPLKIELEFLNSTIKRNLRIKGVFGFALGCLTVCVSRWWAGWDSAGEQEKPEARKMPENGAESHQSAARFVGTLLTCKTHCLKKKMLPPNC